MTIPSTNEKTVENVWRALYYLCLAREGRDELVW